MELTNIFVLSCDAKDTFDHIEESLGNVIFTYDFLVALFSSTEWEEAMVSFTSILDAYKAFSTSENQTYTSVKKLVHNVFPVCANAISRDPLEFGNFNFVSYISSSYFMLQTL